VKTLYHELYCCSAGGAYFIHWLVNELGCDGQCSHKKSRNRGIREKKDPENKYCEGARQASLTYSFRLTVSVLLFSTVLISQMLTISLQIMQR